MTEEKLKACPFCGSSAHVNKANQSKFIKTVDVGKVVDALKSLFDTCQNLLPFKGSTKIYDTPDNANKLYNAMIEAEQALTTHEEE